MNEIYCFYQVFKGYANWQKRDIFKCRECLRDEWNKQCPYYTPIRFFTFKVLPLDRVLWTASSKG